MQAAANGAEQRQPGERLQPRQRQGSHQRADGAAAYARQQIKHARHRRRYPAPVAVRVRLRALADGRSNGGNANGKNAKRCKEQRQQAGRDHQRRDRHPVAGRLQRGDARRVL